ncbi:protoporphyrinogen/coproporphyrinogen oxidase [Auritidibacter ignavus]|uniref:protoporphyrinogen/coproporphyrinogen oxidase n=1 Tax=Auritidibacter ignavus TaxID=678932 RepID=UPI002FE56F3C
MSELPGLQGNHYDVVVIGGGIAGLTAARELSMAGARVAVLEAAMHPGGALAGLELGEAINPTDEQVRHDPNVSLRVDAGAEAFATRGPAVAELITELGLGEEIVAPQASGSWLYTRDRGAIPSPTVGVLGIPGDLHSPDVATALGPEGIARAQQDLSAPVDDYRQVLTDQTPITLAEVVADRMGPAVVDNLVAPVVAGVLSTDPASADVRQLIPGLLDAMVEQGSLAAAITALKRSGRPGAAVNSLRGGMHRIIDALTAELAERGVDLVTSAPVTSLADAETPGGSGYRVLITAAEASEVELSGDRLVLACDAVTSYRLITTLRARRQAPELPTEAQPATGTGVGLVTLLVDHPELDAAPRGTGLLVAPDVTDVAAKAMTHVSAKWAWLHERLNPTGATHRHVLRLSYGRISDPVAGHALGYHSTDDQLITAALADAPQLLGVDTENFAARVRASAVVRWREALPSPTPAHTRAVNALLEAMEPESMMAAGPWVSGTGLLAIISDVRQRARQLIKSPPPVSTPTDQS